MRPSEAAELHWERLPAKEERILENKRKHIGYVDLDRGGFSRVGTKTETRFVPAHPVAINILSRLTKVSKYVFLPERKKLPAGNQPKDHAKQPDRPYSFFRRSFETARAKAKIDVKTIKSYIFQHQIIISTTRPTTNLLSKTTSKIAIF